jgi:hypothetical protein
MKKTTGLLCLLWALASTAYAQEVATGVGINTENPKGILHIDGASTAATTNPPAGKIDSIPALDDLLVDTVGRLSLGAVPPGARLHLRASRPGGALRIEEGTPDKQGKLLVSDAGGRGRWRSVSGGFWWYAALYNCTTPSSASTDTVIRPYTGYTGEFISSDSEGSLNPTTGTITVPSAGRYRITFSIHFGSSRNDIYWAMPALLVNWDGTGSGAGHVRWTPSVWGVGGVTYGWGLFPTFTAILNLKANDVIRIGLDQREQGEPDQTRWHKANGRGSGVQIFMVELIQITT